MIDWEKKLGKIIDKQKIVYIASIDDNGFPNMKAMLAPRVRDGIKTFYFTTNTSSMRVRHFLHNPKASLYISDNRFFKGIMLRGIMEVLEDSKSKELIWRSGDTMYYSKGVTDPDYCVLKFVAENGRFYSDFHSKDFDIE